VLAAGTFSSAGREKKRMLANVIPRKTRPRGHCQGASAVGRWGEGALVEEGRDSSKVTPDRGGKSKGSINGGHRCGHGPPRGA